MNKKNNTKPEEVKATSELTLENILENIDEINGAKKDKEITITHKRLNADFTFLVPQLADLSGTADKDGNMIMTEVYKALSLNLITRITDDMLKALKVKSNAEALAKLFTEDEILIVLASLMEDLEDNGIVIKKQ